VMWETAGEGEVEQLRTSRISQQTNLVRRCLGPLDGLLLRLDLLLNRHSVLVLLDADRHLVRSDFELGGCLDGAGFGCGYEKGLVLIWRGVERTNRQQQPVAPREHAGPPRARPGQQPRQRRLHG
jgi:hypothetical protein